MADNLTTTTTVSTVPSGSVIATDDVSSVHFQKIKIDVGGDGASALLSNSNPLPVSDASGSLTVDNGGTFAVQESGGALTALQLIDDAVYTDGTGTPSKAIGVAGTDGTNPQIIKTDTSGELQVDVLTMPTVAVTQSGTWDEIGINDSGNSITIDATSLPLPTGASTLAEQQTQTTALQLIDDTVATLGTTTYSEATTKGLIIGAVRRDADTTLADTTNEIAPLQVDASGRLKVEAFSGETLPVSLASVPSHAVTNAGTFAVQVDNTVTVGSHAVTNAGTFATQESGSLLTAAQLIDDIVYTDDTSTHSTGTSKGALIMAAATPTDGSVNANDIGAVAMTTDRKLHVAVMDALPAGTNAIGKLAANSGVDIGDVDITSIAAGDNNIGNVDIASIAAGDNNIGNVDLASAIPAGTAAIGKLLPPDVDVTTHTNYARKYYTSAGAATDGIIWSPASGKRWHVVSMYINVSAACTLTLEDDKAGGDDPVWKGEYAANSGVTIHFGEKYPMASGEDAADLLVTTTAGNVYITVVGYEV